MKLPEGVYSIDSDLDSAQATAAALGVRLAPPFTKYKAPKRAPAFFGVAETCHQSDVERVSRGVFLARDLINTPTEYMGPDELIQAGAEVAKHAGAKVRILRGDAPARRTPTIHAVGRASTRAPGLLDFTWGDKNAPKVTLVGKGVCFDTGGLNIKPREGMLQMKKDMGSAAIVLGLAQALMAANTPIRLRVLVPAVETSIAGNALRPLDIIRTRAGKTVEIGDTDAEGRLILCDALAEADSEQPELLDRLRHVDGRSAYRIGARSTGLLLRRRRGRNELSGNCWRGSAIRFWRLPIWRPIAS